MSRHLAWTMVRLYPVCALAAVAAVLAGGCGGSSPAQESPGTGPTLASAPFYFLGDLVTGKVTALPADDPRVSAAGTVSPQVVGTDTGAGSALVVSSSNLFTYGGNPSWRALNLRLTNHMATTVGLLPNEEETGPELLFTSLVFRNAGGGVVNGGSVANPDGYNPNGELPIIRYDAPVLPEATGTRQVAFQVPYPATQVIWGVVVRADTAIPGSFPRLGSHCYVTTVAGNGSTGFADGPAHVAQFEDPTGLHVASNGAVLVADHDNDALREITPDGRVRTISDTGTPILSPVDVTVDEAHSTASAQILYVTSAGSAAIYRVIRNPYNNATNSVSVIAGGGTDVNGANGELLQLPHPYGIDCDLTGGFWVVDSSSNHAYYLRPGAGANPAAAIAPADYKVLQNLTTVGPAEDCTVDDHGNAFFPAAHAEVLYRRDADGTITTIAVPLLAHSACSVNRAGTICYFTDSGTGQVYQARLSGVDPKLPASWTVERLTQGGTTGYRDGSGQTAQFSFVAVGLGLDLAGSLYVADDGNNCIRRIDRLAGE